MSGLRSRAAVSRTISPSAQAGRLRHYITKLTRYLAKDASGAEFLRLHHGEWIF